MVRTDGEILRSRTRVDGLDGDEEREETARQSKAGQYARSVSRHPWA